MNTCWHQKYFNIAEKCEMKLLKPAAPCQYFFFACKEIYRLHIRDNIKHITHTQRILELLIEMRSLNKWQRFRHNNKTNYSLLYNSANRFNTIRNKQNIFDGFTLTGSDSKILHTNTNKNYKTEKRGKRVEWKKWIVFIKDYKL